MALRFREASSSERKCPSDGYGSHTALSRAQTLGEEIANAMSHGVGALLAVAAIPMLLVDAVTGGSTAVEIFAVTVFGATMVLMYLASTLYHALPGGTRSVVPAAKRVFRLLDHSAIYLLIAGTYTPFALGAFREQWGWPMFGIVWGLALAGVVLKCLPGNRRPAVSTALYLAMGWLVVVASEPLFTSLPAAGFGWLLAGGLAYTVGVVFFALDDRLRYAHFAWHLFVLAGTACHFVAVLGYA